MPTITAGERHSAGDVRLSVTRRRHDRVMDDETTSEQIEQLARSFAMTTAMTERDRLTVVELLRELARIRRCSTTPELRSPQV